MLSKKKVLRFLRWLSSVVVHQRKWLLAYPRLTFAALCIAFRVLWALRVSAKNVDTLSSRILNFSRRILASINGTWTCKQRTCLRLLGFSGWGNTKLVMTGCSATLMRYEHRTILSRNGCRTFVSTVCPVTIYPLVPSLRSATLALARWAFLHVFPIFLRLKSTRWHVIRDFTVRRFPWQFYFGFFIGEYVVHLKSLFEML